MSLLLLALLGCAGDDTTTPPPPTIPTADTGVDPCETSVVTWETFGQGFVDTWCTSCHSEILTGDARYGAPVGVDFNTWEQVAAWAQAIRFQAAESVPPLMPPQGGTTDEERALLVEWIDCGLVE